LKDRTEIEASDPLKDHIRFPEANQERIKEWRRELLPFGEELPEVGRKIESPEIVHVDTISNL